MAKMTRRSMLWTTSASVAALAGVAALVSTKQHSTNAEAAAPTTGTMTVFVKDASTGMLSVFQGEQEFVVHNPALVQAIANAAK